MKKYMKLSVLILCLAGCYYFSQTQSKKAIINSVAIDNIEALAQGENDNYICWCDGSIDCHGFKAKYYRTILR